MGFCVYATYNVFVGPPLICVFFVGHLLCVCRPASYGSWQAVTATKVEGPSKEPGPYLYSGITFNDDEPDDDDDDATTKPTI